MCLVLPADKEHLVYVAKKDLIVYKQTLYKNFFKTESYMQEFKYIRLKKNKELPLRKVDSSPYNTVFRKTYIMEKGYHSIPSDRLIDYYHLKKNFNSVFIIPKGSTFCFGLDNNRDNIVGSKLHELNALISSNIIYVGKRGGWITNLILYFKKPVTFKMDEFLEDYSKFAEILK